MNKTLTTALITSCLMSGTVLADDDCNDSVADWQPKERLHQKMTENGWEVKRIKVDDGCYELKGFDRKGNRIEAKFSPASLKIIELAVEFDDSGDASDYLDLGNQSSQEKSDTYINSASDTAKNKPKVTIE
ncbi:PepSY domain-containing protein [uncultured Amphritea sp.]|uniref:PepSY domain-containing protein n=1 Tax=uncultured Amphritea sp. TaxID=981605 RepID=UPI00261D08FF|nr:PepSY domain-containing protein [uncultured Amphritea sp.]